LPFSLADSTHCLEALLAGGCKDVQTLIRSEAPESRDWIIHDAELPALNILIFQRLSIFGGFTQLTRFVGFNPPT
jgi:hypothetical protein